jgi:hypothetical protein
LFYCQTLADRPPSASFSTPVPVVLPFGNALPPSRLRKISRLSRRYSIAISLANPYGKRIKAAGQNEFPATFLLSKLQRQFGCAGVLTVFNALNPR